MKTTNEHKLILELSNQKEEARELIISYLQYLSSDKFAGFDNNYVNASEVREILRQIKNILA